LSRCRALTLAVTAFAALGLVVAGCGGGGGGTTAAAPPPAETPPAETGGGGGGGAATTLDLAADASGALKFDKTSLEAPAGKVVIHFTNDSPVPHNVSIEGNGVDVEGETFTGGSKDTTADLQPGTYTFYCSVPGHREAGMEGTITVS
jgi:plastocyanin